jgi:hypothetical protein
MLLSESDIYNHLMAVKKTIRNVSDNSRESRRALIKLKAWFQKQYVSIIAQVSKIVKIL